jgi:hypothetical protein
MKLVLEPIFEADFHDCSYGYRPKRDAQQASLAIREDLYNRAKSVQQKIRNRLKYLTSRRAPISPKEYVEMVSPIVLGWANYFRHTNASQAFRGLQRFVNIRFRRYLTQRSKGRGFGWKRFPNSKLYAMGLTYIGSGMLEYVSKPVHGGR